MIALATKRCSKCKEVKPVKDFSRDLRTPSGYKSQCRECQRWYWRRKRNSPPSPSARTLEKTADIDLGITLLHRRCIPGVEMTAHDIAAWAGCSRQMIDQIEHGAMRKVRHALMERGLWEDLRETFAAAFNRREERVEV